jgi:SAM-dependent methyltransferase
LRKGGWDLRGVQAIESYICFILAIKEHQISFMASIEGARESYSSEWALTSNFFKEKGYYDWCASNLERNIKVLEIGIGVGNGTLSLLNRGCNITGIEENEYNIQKATDSFKALEIPFLAVLREKRVTIENDRYDVEYFDIDLSQVDLNLLPIVLMQGDFILDQKLQGWLKTGDKYDTVLCWFSGIQALIYRHVGHNVKSPPEYRMLLHDFIFNSAHSVLKPSGIINICDRLPYLDSVRELILIKELEGRYRFRERGLMVVGLNKIMVEGFDVVDGMRHFSAGKIETGEKMAIYSISVGLTNSLHI